MRLLELALNCCTVVGIFVVLVAIVLAGCVANDIVRIKKENK